MNLVCVTQKYPGANDRFKTVDVDDVVNLRIRWRGHFGIHSALGLKWHHNNKIVAHLFGKVNRFQPSKATLTGRLSCRPKTPSGYIANIDLLIILAMYPEATQNLFRG
jgi:hypothetical protein